MATRKNYEDAVSQYLGGARENSDQEDKRINRDGRSRSRAALRNSIDKNSAGYVAATISVNIGLYDKMKEIAFREGVTIKKIMEQAMKQTIGIYEKKNGEIHIKKLKHTDIASIFDI